MNSATRIQYIIGAIIILVLIAIGAYVFWQGAHKPGFVQGGEATTSATTTTQIGPNTYVVSGPGGSYTITQLDSTDIPPAPSFTGKIACPASMSAEQCAAIQTQDAAIVAKLSKDSTDSQSWITLGVIRKETGDYNGAISAWTYVTKVYPTSPIAFLNLGDLYMNFVHDYAKAEANYLAAIKIKTDNPAPYEDLFELYTNTSYKPSNTAAADILKKGIAANPTAINLEVDLARYYRGAGDTTDANAEYDAAIANAQSQGQTSLATQLQNEKAGK